MKSSLVILFALCVSVIYPATSISRWFSSSYQDLRMTLRRYGHCVSDLPPFRDQYLNETEYLVNQMKVFLDQANYDNEQLTNISALMDNICRYDLDTQYPISVNIDVTKYNNTDTGKENRCKAIDEAMDSMFNVFKRAALNKSEPIDFSVIQFYPVKTNKAVSYNLTDLINTSWIKSDTVLEHVCKITDSVKDYIQNRTSNSTAQDRSQQQHVTGYFNAILDYVNRILDRVFGATKRQYLESSSMLELVNLRISNQLGNLMGGLEKRVRSTRDRVVIMFSPSSSTNSSSNWNITLVPQNGTISIPQKINASQPLVAEPLSQIIVQKPPPETQSHREVHGPNSEMGRDV